MYDRLIEIRTLLYLFRQRIRILQWCTEILVWNRCDVPFSVRWPHQILLQHQPSTWQLSKEFHLETTYQHSRTGKTELSYSWDLNYSRAAIWYWKMTVVKASWASWLLIGKISISWPEDIVHFQNFLSITPPEIHWDPFKFCNWFI